MKTIRHLTILTLTIMIALTGLSVLTVQLPYFQSGHALAAAGVGPGQCVRNCQNHPNPGGGGGGAGGGGGGTAPATVGPNTPADQAACNGLNQLGGTSCGQPGNPQNGQSAIASVASRIVTIISYIAGIAAIIMIIISGVRYTTSGGDSTKVGSAKTGLIYALIGIAIAALAQVLVHFVLNQASGV